MCEYVWCVWINISEEYLRSALYLRIQLPMNKCDTTVYTVNVQAFNCEVSYINCISSVTASEFDELTMTEWQLLKYCGKSLLESAYICMWSICHTHVHFSKANLFSMCPFILFTETAQDSVHSLLLKYHLLHSTMLYISSLVLCRLPFHTWRKSHNSTPVCVSGYGNWLIVDLNT